MTPARYIRESIFGIPTQHQFAAMLGYSQANISRFESDRLSREAQERIRDLAKGRGIKWNDSWFFEVPGQPGD